MLELQLSAAACVSPQPVVAPASPHVHPSPTSVQLQGSAPTPPEQALIRAPASVQGDIVKLREVYDGFLAEFPLCYGYWKKYADAEQRNGSPELATSVFERGTAAIPYSVDLWGHMCTYKIQQKASAEEVRM